MSPHGASEIIQTAKSRLGKDLVILAHHYMADQVARHADRTGDSLELSRMIPELDAHYIVFCGVFFMAETAAVLAKPGQKVLLPEMNSRCVMSDMAPHWLLTNILNRLDQAGVRVTPLTYVNSSAAVKAVVGSHGGSVCTSSNAETMLRWAQAQGGPTLFLPDVRLGMNTCDRLDIPRDDRLVLDIRELGSLVDPERAARHRVLLWPGQCVAHARFKPHHVHEARRENPGCRVVVHPECHPGVVALSDACGSTSFIIRYVDQAPAGSTIYVGTELNLVLRLAHTYKGIKQVRPLTPSTCSNMAKVNEDALANTLVGLDTLPEVTVDEAQKIPARLALTRMLEACAR